MKENRSALLLCKLKFTYTAFYKGFRILRDLPILAVNMNQRTNIRIVSLNDKGLPSTRKCPVLGDMYLAPSLTDPETYDQWIWAGANLEWQRIGSIPSFDEERTMRDQRVENVRRYFRERKQSL